MDLLGDIGGVLKGLISIIGIFIAPITDHKFFLELISKLFLAKSKTTDLFKNKEKTKNRNNKPKQYKKQKNELKE